MSNSSPLVSVICLCYNHQDYVTEALQSVLALEYDNVELIIVDDASTDNSVSVIRTFVNNHPDCKFIPMETNHGNCKAFNIGLASSRGEYIIDLAADDILLPHRIREGVKYLAERGNTFGVHFCDAEYISKAGEKMYIHSDRFPHHTIPQGDVYKDVIQRFFICPPTIMFRREVVEYLGGYDETLAYEDFDFWIRSSRKYGYCYSPKVLVKKRVLKNSLSARQFSFFSSQLHTTYKVCKKIMALNRTSEEQNALSKRIVYEMRVAVQVFKPGLALNYLWLWFRNRLKKYQA